ncbi:exopolysaccharide biosynthesis polyprenyl glycosylphosphotransferase [Micromonospora sp. STR1s_5]|nr:exopolysaccharide biosynthesis polyprenyl glycosylphosphotransferase [Micromonospora sp. STR1s_5]
MSHPASAYVASHTAPFPSPLLPGSASLAVALLDIAAIVLAGILAALMYWAFTGDSVEAGFCLGVSGLLATLFVVLMHSWGLNDTRNLLRTDRQAKWAATAWLASLGLVLGLAFLLKASGDLSRGAIGLFAGFGMIVLVAHRLAWRYGFARALARGVLRRRRAFALSLKPWTETGQQMHLLRRAGMEVTARHLIPDAPEQRAQAVARVLAAARQERPDEIVLLVAPDDLPRVDALVADLRSLPVPIRLLPDATLSMLSLQPSSPIGPCALVELTREPLTLAERAQKRAFDVVVALFGLLAAAPLLVLAIVAIRLDAPGPVLFRQTRRGFNGRTFRILKLRTMSVLEDGGSIPQATRRDPRVTRVGAWLRRTSIDELPQLWNVLRGEMSIVGPRPHAVAHDDHYHRLIQNYAFRHHVKPGITGWAQVNGHRGETPDVAMMAARVEHDLWYVGNWSMRIDLRIVFLTFVRLLAPTAY